MTHKKAMTILFLSSMEAQKDQYFDKSYFEKYAGFEVTNTELKQLLENAINYIKGVSFIKEEEKDLFYIGY